MSRRNSRLAERYEIRYSVPSRCAEDLFTGFADIGLVPAAAFAIDPSMLIIPGCAIASKGRIRSIILVTREGGPGGSPHGSDGHFVADFGGLHRDSSSVNIGMLRRNFTPAAPNLNVMLQTADAALLIGDPALSGSRRQPGAFSNGPVKTCSISIWGMSGYGEREFHGFSAFLGDSRCGSGRRVNFAGDAGCRLCHVTQPRTRSYRRAG